LRRDHAKYLAMIDAVTFLFQHQRTVKTNRFADGSTMDYIEVTSADIALANRLATAVLGRCVDELPPQTRVLWDGLQRYAQSEAQRVPQAVQSVTFDRRAAAMALGWSYKQVRLHLERLVSEDFVVAMTTSVGQVMRYRLVDGLDAAGRLDLRLGEEKSPTCTTTTLPMKHGGLPEKHGGLPVPCPMAWARSNDGQTPSFGAIFRGVPRFSISRGGDISPKITSYMQIVGADVHAHADAS
jgi:hypothetical protein